ncbi:hypothetical protein MTR67_030308 [Solanum verrucosum]|uniref:Chitin-binding type-1 domain-containing protein n=1 Tax=Solanum verrucosum TaxID=315347 RepID=A0AAF0U114_SOLVR|nr:hypothetical protein MTR67_030308 [Solanum verrucosum]
MKFSSALVFVILSLLLTTTYAQQCGQQNGKRKCPNKACCSKFGWCGNSCNYYGSGCQSNCHARGCITTMFANETVNNSGEHLDEGNFN